MAGILALFDGRCGLCDQPILAGVHSIVLVDGVYCHDTCAGDEGQLSLDAGRAA